MSIRDWLRREIAAVVDADLRKIRLHTDDPIRAFEENRAQISAQLRTATNHLGEGVMVGREVVIWGGRTSEAVGLHLHDHVRIYDGCRLVIDRMSSDSGIVIGTRAALNFGCYIDGSGGVQIGARTILGPHVVIVSSSHRVDRAIAVQESGKLFESVRIGEDVWVGAGAIIRMGITIGDGAVIGAGSVVTHDVPGKTTAAGNPARVLTHDV
jgi:acetyltransferase-like isoleucine patch superfamily enzyme